MENRKVRNEFGLDEYNALDVQKERAKDAIPWLLCAAAFLAATAFMIAVTNRQAS